MFRVVLGVLRFGFCGLGGFGRLGLRFRLFGGFGLFCVVGLCGGCAVAWFVVWWISGDLSFVVCAV